jgi:hypothetical protein
VKSFLPALLLGLGLSTATITPAAAYPVDCAILLCLAGGFPASEPCNAAYAEMIRRITPWPIEPPLQLWRCPMSAGLDGRPEGASRVFEASFQQPPQMTELLQAKPVHRLWQAFGETVTDYVMAIKVYDMTYRRHYSSTDDSCNINGKFRIGSYDTGGEFTWRTAAYSESPNWFLDTSSTSCADVLFRAVGMEWRDYSDEKGTEVVPY